MKKPLFFIALFCLANAACKTNSETDKINRTDVDNLLAKWEQAFYKKDTSLLSQVLHTNYIYSGNADGSISDKKAVMNNLSVDNSQLLAQDLYDLNVQYYSNIAIVRGWENLKIKTDVGDTINIKLRFTDVYKKENGNTEALSTHSSPINQ